MSTEFEFEDRGFTSGMSGFLTDLEALAAAKVEEYSFTIANSAKRYCPVATGRLRSSIGTMRKGKDMRGVWADVGSNVEYAIYVEMGTHKMAAQPFLRPAFMESGLTPVSESGGSGGGG